MKVTVISDTHGAHEQINLNAFKDTDVLIHAGDFAMSKRNAVPQAYKFLKWFNQINVPHKILVAGNHDYAPYEAEGFLAALRERYASITYLQDSETIIEGYKFYGSPYSNEFCGWAFMEDELDLIQIWEQIPDDTNILITHGPSRGILDKVVRDETHVGSSTLTERIEQLNDLKVHVSGHIHEAYGIHYDKHLSINASLMTEQYWPINPPISFTLKDI